MIIVDYLHKKTSVHGSLPVYQRQQPSWIRRLVVIARRLRKMNKPTPPRHTSVARFHSEICRSCHVFDGPGDSTGGAHLNMKEGGGFLENLESCRPRERFAQYWSMQIVRTSEKRRKKKKKVNANSFVRPLPFD